MRHATEHDVVVVGGGPAGAAIAARLARRGRDVLLLDRAAFPRRKACGECLNPGAVRALARLGALERVKRAHPAPLAGWEIVPSRGSAFTGSFPAGASGLALPRAVLDALLLEHARAAGAEVRLGERVADLVWEGGFVRGVRTTGGEVRARLVVGADGLRSVVLRRLGLLRRRPRLRKLALAAHVRGHEKATGWGRMHVLARGCIGAVDVGDGAANVVVVVEAREAAGMRGEAAAYFDAALKSIPSLRPAERADEVLATGPFDWPVRSAVANGALLVGDAAGYFDPFTGQGIYRALHGAELAARAADAALEAGDTSMNRLASYERARRRAFHAGERLQRLIEGVVARPRALATAAAVLSARPRLADALVTVTGDVAPFRSLLRPGLLAPAR